MRHKHKQIGREQLLAACGRWQVADGKKVAGKWQLAMKKRITITGHCGIYEESKANFT